jgi:hypothetical protein
MERVTCPKDRLLIRPLDPEVPLDANYPSNVLKRWLISTRQQIDQDWNMKIK